MGCNDNNILTQIDSEVSGESLRIYSDYDAESPREWDNLGTMVCWHRRYRLGDQDHGFRDPDEFREEITDLNSIILPLFLYDHSGITISTGAFSCPWDSGQVGWIYVLKTDVYKEYGCKRISKTMRERVVKYLVGEVETFDVFLRGDVMGYEIIDKEGEIIDGCGGFYDLDSLYDEAGIEWKALVA